MDYVFERHGQAGQASYRALAPAAMRGLRLGLFAVLIIAFLIMGGFVTAAAGIQRLGSLQRVGQEYYPRDDFVAFYSAGSLARAGKGAAAYDLAAISRAEYRATGSRLPSGFTMPFFNPPYALLLLAPLSRLPIAAAGAVWLAISFLLFAAGIALLLATYPRSIPPAIAAAGLLGIVSSEPLFHTVVMGQFSFLLALGVCLLFVGLRRPHPAYPIAGLLLLSLKPQLLFLPLLFLLLQRRYRVLAGAAAAAAVLMLAATALAGPQVILNWLRLTAQAGVWDNQYTISSFHQYGWVGLVGTLWGPGHVALRRLLVTGLDLLTIAGVGLLLYRGGIGGRVRLQFNQGRRRGQSDTVLFALAMVGALLASPNLNPQEFILLVPVLLALYQSPEVRRETVALFAAAGWLITYLFLAVLQTAFTIVWPSMGWLRDPHANPLVLGISYTSPGTLYLLALLAWLVHRQLAGSRDPEDRLGRDLARPSLLDGNGTRWTWPDLGPESAPDRRPAYGQAAASAANGAQRGMRASTEQGAGHEHTPCRRGYPIFYGTSSHGATWHGANWPCCGETSGRCRASQPGAGGDVSPSNAASSL